MDPATVSAVTEAQRLLKKHRDRDGSFAKWLNGVAAVTAVAGLFGALGSFFVSERTNVDFFGEKAAMQSRSELDNRVVRSLGQLQMDVATLRKAQATIAQLPPSDKTGLQLAVINAKLDGVAQRQDRLEQAIQSNPEKALSMPLMRRDIDNMRESNAQSVAAIRANVDQVYDLTKWLLGALAVGVFSLAIANFFQRKSDV